MYIHLSWNSQTLGGRVFYAPNAIKNVILVKFDRVIHGLEKSMLLIYENKEWTDKDCSQTNQKIISLLLEKLTNVIRSVQSDN